MRISVRSGSRAWMPSLCPQRLRARVYATVRLALRGSPVAIAREIWGVRSESTHPHPSPHTALLNGARFSEEMVKETVEHQPHLVPVSVT